MDIQNKYEDLSPLKKALIAVNEMQQKIKKLESEKNEPIAIIGMAAKFPKANNINEFWENLLNNVDCISEVPKDRWNIDEFYDERKNIPGKMNSRYGGFINDCDKFDASFFGISPREAMQMDPQQRILLETSWYAFENANINPTALAGSKTGVFVGISSNDYSFVQLDKSQNDYKIIDAYQGTGNANSIAANRLSYFYNFQGPSISIDTACSSSLVALHLACQSLRAMESKLAIAGGVNLILSPHATITFSQAQMLSSNGKCKSFDSKADGYVRSEGVGVLVLQRLSEALKDGNKILAVIKGSAVNQDGRTNGLTAPNSLAQFQVINQALLNAKLKSDDIDFIETMGTGTILGDAIELQGLKMVMKERNVNRKCIIGAVKSNIGHLESASGMASLIKTVLVLKNQIVPANINFSEINQHIDKNNFNYTIPSTNIRLDELNKIKYAGVSSFGFGGTNAHVILESFNDIISLNVNNEINSHILCLSAHNNDSLKNLVNLYNQHLDEKNINVSNICYTANSSKKHFCNRVAIVGNTKQEISKSLRKFVNNEADGSVVINENSENLKLKTAFLFNGLDSQNINMAKELYFSHPYFMKTLNECFRISDNYTSIPLKEIIFSENEEKNILNETEFAQPALFIIEYSLAKLWLSWGINPDYLLGDGIGEFTAACIGGVFTLEDAIKLTSFRGKLIQSLPKIGAMVTVFANKVFISSVLEKFNNNVSIAVSYGPTNTVISGEKTEIEKILNELKNNDVDFSLLDVSHAFHSTLMQSILDEFNSFASSINYSKTNIPIVSNLSAEVLNSDFSFNAEYWTKHLISSIKLEESFQTLLAKGCNVFIEVGPNPTLSKIAQYEKNNESLLWLHSLKSGESDWDVILKNLAKLYVNGLEVNWTNFYQDFEVSKVELPNYTFKKDRYYVEESKNKTFNFSENIDKYKFIILENGSSKSSVKVVNEKNEIVFELPNMNYEKMFSEDEFNNFKNSANNEIKEDIKNNSSDFHEFSLEEIKRLNDDEKVIMLINYLKRKLSAILKYNDNNIDEKISITNLGLDSITAIELKSKIENLLKIEIPITQFIKGPSISELVEIIILNLRNQNLQQNDLVKTLAVEGEYDLSFGQNAMWFQQQMAPEGIYNPTYAAKINGKLDIDKLTNSINLILYRHPVLRTSYSFKNGKLSQQINDKVDFPLTIIDCIGLSKDESNRKVNKLASSNFDLTQGKVFKVYLFLLEHESIILLTAHHIAVDFWSLSIIINELLFLYNYGKEILMPIKHSYFDYVQWQKELLNSLQGKELLEFWKRKLEGDLPNLNLPTKQRRKPIQSFDGTVIKFSIENELKGKLKELSHAENATIYMVLFSIYNTLLHKYTHQNEIIVGTPSSGRTKTEFNNIVGYFVNPISIKTNLVSSINFNDLLKQTKINLLEAIEHQDLPFNYIVEKLKPERDPSRTPIFQVMFVYQKAQLLFDEGLSEFAVGFENAQMSFGDMHFEYYSLEENKSIFDMTFIVAETKDGISGSIVYNKDLFKENFIKEFYNNFVRISNQVVQNPKIKISELKLVDFPEVNLSENYYSNELIENEFVHKAFEHQVVKYPNKNAVQFKNESISFLQLNKEANKIANYLLSKKLQPENKIGVFIDRSFAMIKSILGIMKAGFVYVPIDTIYPEERILNIIADADIKFIISQEKYCEKLLNKNLEIMCIDKDEDIISSSYLNPNVKINSTNLAYSIYTSGSTGIPKGVLLTHIGLSNLVNNQTKIFNINSESVVLQLASLSFDASVSEIFTSLVNGATLQLISNEVLLSGSALISELNDKKVSVATIPPSLLAVIPYDKLPNLKTLVSAGELCTNDIVKKWSNGRKFINAYGPTEITVCATTYEINRTHSSESIPIGNSINGIKCFIFDQDLNLVPTGVIGELYICGIGVARGYNKLPELTAEKFIPNPYAEYPGERLYKTGDVVKLRDDGNFEFFGRSDDQIKFRGFRIELKEIQTVLENHNKIKKAEVILKKLSNNEKRLIAFYISEDNKEISKTEFRDYFIEHLPEYMIPSNFIRLDEIPLTTNGKVNKKFLDGYKIIDLQNTFFENPQSEFEKNITNIWQNVLQLEKISRNDNFFDLGGHSLNVIQVQSEVKDKFGIELSVVDFFKYPTIKLFSEFLQNGNQLNTAEVTIKERVSLQKQKLQMHQERMKKRKI